MTIAEQIIRAKSDYDEVYKAGKNAEYNAFWDNYQQNGNRKLYGTAFGGAGWNDSTFKPKYDIQPTDAYMMFRGTEITDLTNKEVTIDFSKLTAAQYMFQWARKLTHAGVFNLTNLVGLDSMFYGCSVLHTIDKLILKQDGTNTFGATFSSCTSLQNIVIEGVIGNNFDIKSSPLTKASITSIINALSPTVSGKTVTFSKDAITNAFGSSDSEEWQNLIATKSNWRIDLV